MSEPYKIERVKVGILNKQKIASVKMPRARFVEIVEETLDNRRDYYNAIREDMVATASAMPRYPISDWVNLDRGCGCVVGEYLVARSELERATFIEENSRNGYMMPIYVLLRESPHAGALESFGFAINDAIRIELWLRGVIDHEDSSAGPERVTSVEIVDEEAS